MIPRFLSWAKRNRIIIYRGGKVCEKAEIGKNMRKSFWTFKFDMPIRNPSGYTDWTGV